MGSNAEQNQLPIKKFSKKKKTLFLVAGALMVIFSALKWSDVVEYINGEPQLTLKHQERLRKKLFELQEGEQYALIARKEGQYPCVHNGYRHYYLHSGEVWKYGTTIKGQEGRYGTEFMKQNSLSYIVEFRGSMGECLQQEQIKLFQYPLLPENLARPETVRLLRPPGNPIYR